MCVVGWADPEESRIRGGWSDIQAIKIQKVGDIRSAPLPYISALQRAHSCGQMLPRTFHSVYIFRLLSYPSSCFNLLIESSPLYKF
jgi:hypothetical protein